MQVVRRLLSFAGIIAGCALDLPEESLVVDTRILMVRATPTGALRDLPVPAAFAIGDAVRLELLVLGPEGIVAAETDLVVTWFACPLVVGQAAFSCIEDSVPIDTSVPPCPMDAATPLTEVCALSTASSPEWIVPAPASPEQPGIGVVAVVATHEGTDPERCTAALLAGDYDTPDDCLYAAYQLHRRGVDDTTNHHPSPPRIRAEVVLDDEVLDSFVVGMGSSVDVARSRELRLVPELDDGDAEVYAVPVNGGAGSVLVDERIRARWYRTSGAFAEQAGPVAPDAPIDETWSPETTDAATLAVVLADGRGGLSAWWCSIRVTP